MNAYELLNEELKRMHAEKARLYSLAVELESSPDYTGSPHYSNHSNSRYSINNQLANEVRNRHYALEIEIRELRSVMIGMVRDADKNIQEKVAEMALTGISNG